MKTKTKSFIVSGYSMYPILKPKQTIKVEKTDKLREGDIIAFKKGKSRFFKKPISLVHRIVKLDRRGIITKGDNLLSFDKKIRKNQIIGRVCQIGNKKIKYGFSDKIISEVSNIEGKLYILIKKHISGKKYNNSSNSWRLIKKALRFFNRAFKKSYRLFEK